MCSTLPDFLTKMVRLSLRPVEEVCRDALAGRLYLILRNTGFIITGPSVCVFVECRQVIEEFINRLMVFKGGTCVGGA